MLKIAERAEKGEKNLFFFRKRNSHFGQFFRFTLFKTFDMLGISFQIDLFEPLRKTRFPRFQAKETCDDLQCSSTTF